MESDHVTLYSSDTRHSQMNEENEKGMGGGVFWLAQSENRISFPS